MIVGEPTGLSRRFRAMNSAGTSPAARLKFPANSPLLDSFSSYA